ncbi:MAG TPA: helix-turn-helix domain-containing protein, partial [Geobacteraceae bacterium]|nr:helix-turn-helix domain-containing protein [Geobacteraceae bacterium]
LSAMRTGGIPAAPRRGLKETEAKTIKNALELHRWNITEAARALGIGRNTLYRKISQFKLSR